MLEALEVVGDTRDASLGDVSQVIIYIYIYICPLHKTSCSKSYPISLLNIKLMQKTTWLKSFCVFFCVCQGFEVVNNRYMSSFDDDDSPSGSGFRTKLREFHKR